MDGTTLHRLFRDWLGQYAAGDVAGERSEDLSAGVGRIRSGVAFTGDEMYERG